MKSSRCILTLPGINNRNNIAGCATKMADWIDWYTFWDSKPLDYHVEVYDSRFFEHGIVQTTIAALEEELKHHTTISAITHSKGGGIICEAIKELNGRVTNLHLLAGACSANFVKNGLNQALLSGKVGQVFVHFSSSDYAMWAAWLWEIITLGWGSFGTLGLKGPFLSTINPKVRGRVHLRPHPGFGHSSYFHVDNFEQLMKEITSDESTL